MLSISFFFSKITLLLYFQLSKYLSKDTYMSVDKSSDKIRKYTSSVYSFYVEVKMGNIPQQSTYVLYQSKYMLINT